MLHTHRVDLVATCSASAMLPTPNRLRRSADFSAVLRGGRRSAQPTLTVHLGRAAGTNGSIPTRAGLIVGKAVGNSVVRHRVSRRLRAQLAARLPGLPAGCDLVVRALPRAVTATSADLGADLEAALRELAGSRRRTARPEGRA